MSYGVVDTDVASTILTDRHPPGAVTVNVRGVLPADVAATLETAERAFARDDWPTAFTSFRAAGEAADLSADQWYSLAESAWWLGEIDVALDAWKPAHDDYVASGDLSRAAMSAMFQGLSLVGTRRRRRWIGLDAPDAAPARRGAWRSGARVPALVPDLHGDGGRRPRRRDGLGR